MSNTLRHPQPDSLPPTARAIALLLASTPAVADAHPTVIHQLLDFAHRYTGQVLGDASVYAEHAGRQSGRVEMDDVILAVQARVGWEFGGRVPKEYMTQMAAQTNATPLPAIPEVFGVRLPPLQDTLAGVTFDLFPHKPPPGTQQYDEVVEEIEESDDEDDEDDQTYQDSRRRTRGDADASAPPMAPVRAIQDADMDIVGDEQSDEDDDEGLFGDDDQDGGSSDGAMSEVLPEKSGMKRKLVEDDDYD